MNEIKVFESTEFGNLRTVEVNGAPWFVAADVCGALDIANSTQAVARLDEDERAMFNIGRQGETNCVNEPGLYALVLGSRKPEAKAFKRWITHEVVPAIRKSGGYIAGQEVMTPEELMAKALLVAQNTIAEREARISQLTVQNTIMAPKADYFDQLVDRNLLTNFRDTAKELQIKERVFVDWLLEHKYVYRDKKGKLTPTAAKGVGLFEVKECVNEKTQWKGVQTLITPKGRETFRLLMQGQGA